MRFRGKTIRRKIVALLLVPLLSLTVIWGVTTVVTGHAAVQLLSAYTVVDKVGFPIEETARVLQDERRATLVYLADPRASDAPARLHEQRDATNARVAEVRANAENPDVREEMSAETARRLDSLLEAFDGIDTLRRTVEDGSISADQALMLYNRLIDPCHSFLSGLNVVNDVPLDKEGQALVDLARTRELLSRQDALIAAVLVRGRVDADQQRQMADYRARRELRSEVSLELLPSADRERFERYWKSPAATPLLELEKNVVEGRTGTPRGITSATWDKAAKTVLDDLGKLNNEAGDRYQERVEPEVVGIFVRAGAAGVLGLLALLFSLVLSVRIGRELIRDLSRLRKDAHEVSGVRLPSVMRRLAAGEQVDVETEAPRLEYEKDEMGQVGQALNTLQRAAVEAAVKQADMRRGVSEVFVNLARRSQVLLHKQLTLLDAMERRTEDTEELADLFRLDHLTTRMRRHAEGLVILSGAAPSRQWRKPVPLMDVVRAAVAEVEDYERIEVRRLARIAVTGPAVADLTHLVAELLENATVFSPPHTAVQVHGERVANGFTLEIHDRGLGMTPDALLDANLRLAETPEFELSDTDRLGLYVVSRLAQRQNVRVSLQPSPYGGTTAVVFVPDVLLTAAPDGDTSGGIRLDRASVGLDEESPAERTARLTKVPAPLAGLPKSVLESAVLDGPVELEAPVDVAERVRGLDLSDLGGADDIEDNDSERGGLFRPRRKSTGKGRGRGQGQYPGEHQQARDGAHGGESVRPDAAVPAPLPRRRSQAMPKLVSSHGRPVGDGPEPAERSGRPSGERSDERVLTPREELLGDFPAQLDARAQSGSDGGDASTERGTPAPDPIVEPVRDQAQPTGRGSDAPATPATPATLGTPGSGTPETPAPESRPKPAPYEDIPTAALPRRVRQASLAPQLKGEPQRKPVRDEAPADRDAEEVRSRMAALQRGWQRGRRDNGETEGGSSEPAPPHPRTPDEPRPGEADRPDSGDRYDRADRPAPGTLGTRTTEDPRPGTAEDETAHRTTEGDGR